MADTFTADDPTLRQRIARMLSGDAKPGSIRHHLADALAGGQVEGAGSPLPLLTTMTPLGAVTAMDEANRAGKKGDIGGAAIAAMGAIPGAGKVGSKAFQEAVEGAADLYRTFAGNKDKVIKELMANGHTAGDAASAFQVVHNHFNDPSSEVNQLRNAVAQRKGNRTPGTPGRDEALMGHIHEIMARKGEGPGDITPATALNDELEHSAQLNDIAGGDPHKLNFIKNAMEDEGGNVPEEVAQVFSDHLSQRAAAGDKGATELYNKLHGEHGTDGNSEELAQRLMDHYSIPQLLSMHYDLNPEMMGKAYEMPSTVKPRGMKPTQ